jgi:Spy/CpxP family protein refolding chaperone
MTKTKLVVLLGFLVAFGAGLAVGMRSQLPVVQADGPRRMPPPSPGEVLKRELDLTAEQAEQVKKIWSEVLPGPGRDFREVELRRRGLRKERDDAIAALIQPPEMNAYDRILQDYSNKMAQLDEERGKGFREAVEKTKEILTPAQREKYEQMRKRHEAERNGRGFGRRPDEHATTRPMP